MGLASRLVAVAGLVGGGLVAPLTVVSSADAVVAGQVEYVVAATADHAPAEVPSSCTLREAIRTAGLDSTEQTACGQGAWVAGTARTAHITFAGAGRGVVGLDTQLVFPQRSGTEIWIDGAGEPGDDPVTVSGQDKTRIMWADSWPEQTVSSLNGSLVLRDITFADARTPVDGPSGGGAIRSGKQMDLDVDRVTFARNEATAGSALYLLGSASIRNSTFAHNHSRTEEARTGAVTLVNEATTLHGSTFLHNTVEGADPMYGRDLSVVTGAFADSASLTLSYNVFIAADGDNTPSCRLEGSDMRVVFGAHNLHSSGSVLGRCFTAEGGMGGASSATLETVPDSAGRTLTSHGGWVDTVLLTADSGSHDISEHPLAPWCSKHLTKPTRLDLDPGGTDARGVVRPTTTCDAGAVQRDAQTIDMPPASTVTYLGGDFPEPTATSGGPVGLVSTTPTVCDVAAGEVLLLTLGTCTLTATQPGTDLFRAATVTQSYEVTRTPRTVTIDNEPTTPRVGSQWTVAATSSDGSTPTYSTSTEDICSVVGAVVTFNAVGACTVRAELAETAAALGVWDEATLQVAPAAVAQTIAWNPASPTGQVGQTITVTATGGGSGNPVTVTGPPTPRKGKAVCTVVRVDQSGASSKATVRLNAVGTCALRAEQAGDDDHTSAVDTVSFSVVRKSGGRK